MKFRDFLIESLQGDFQKLIKKAKQGELEKIVNDMGKAYDDGKLNDAEYKMLLAMADKKMETFNESMQDTRMEMYKFLKKKFDITFRYTPEEFKEDEIIDYNKDLKIYINKKNRLFNFEWK